VRKKNPSYHLKMGLAVAALFPAFFLLTNPYAGHFVNRFLSSFSFIFILWLINTFLGKRLITIGISFALAVVVYLLIGYTIDNTGLLLQQVRTDQPAPAKAWLFLVMRLILLDAMVISIRYLYDHYNEKKEMAFEHELLKRAHLHARHEALKQQVSPHFLFNSLNTLSSLIKQNPDDALLFTKELSSVYRYMLVHQDKAMVPLNEEIAFLKSYVYLLGIRFAEAIQTTIDIDESFLENSIPPNTLQLLIENAVKHNSFSGKMPLCISIAAAGAYLTVRNNRQSKPADGSSSGIGLENIRARYLLAGGKDIVIEKDENHFQVMLPII
jgi:two-component system LytT family sensor kinase